MNKKTTIILIALFFIIGGAYVLSNSKDEISPTESTEQTTTLNASSTSSNMVIIDKLDFQQKEITIKKGGTVTWKNNDSARHNVIFDDSSEGSVENERLIGQGESLAHTFTETGVFSYHCGPHPYMKAKVTVTD